MGTIAGGKTIEREDKKYSPAVTPMGTGDSIPTFDGESNSSPSRSDYKSEEIPVRSRINFALDGAAVREKSKM